MRPVTLTAVLAVALGLATSLGFASSVRAQALEPTKGEDQTALDDALDHGNELFEAWIVEPTGAVLFFDVVFWDDDRAALAERCEEAALSEAVCAAMVGAAPNIDARKAACVDAGGDKLTCRDVAGGFELPFIVLWLVAGAFFFTLRFRFINLRGFGHALAVTAGRYDDPDDPGEVSHFQALSSALSATVGLGNIAGVAVAVGLGGPGAVLWMIVAGFIGMSSKFTECALGQLYRKVDATGTVSGGPMRYLKDGVTALGGRRMKALGSGLAILFSVLCIGASFGGGNMFQANQSYAQVAEVVPFLDGALGSVLYGVGLAFLVGVVIIGGIRRIATVASFIVPFMCGVYVLAGLYILVKNAGQVPAALGFIVTEAFTPEAGFGGIAGVLVQGFRRAAFSNEAGIGSAAIAHSAAATDEPVREGLVAVLEPFIDTIIVCTMTASVLVVTGAYKEPGEGVVMTSHAFGTALPWFPKVLSFAVLLFAFSTMISWSYYGERCWAFLFGPRLSMIYRGLFVLFVVLGAILDLGAVLEFSDLMLLGMSFPNVLGMILLSGKLDTALRDYWGRYRSGAMLPTSRERAQGRG
jgi:AGCS family alanine or glycine:cation symporter